MTIPPDELELRHDLAVVLNQHRIDSQMNTKDWILADYLVLSLKQLNCTIQAIDRYNDL